MLIWSGRWVMWCWGWLTFIKVYSVFFSFSSSTSVTWIVALAGHPWFIAYFIVSVWRAWMFEYFTRLLNHLLILTADGIWTYQIINCPSTLLSENLKLSVYFLFCDAEQGVWTHVMMIRDWNRDEAGHWYELRHMSCYQIMLEWGMD